MVGVGKYGGSRDAAKAALFVKWVEAVGERGWAEDTVRRMMSLAAPMVVLREGRMFSF